MEKMRLYPLFEGFPAVRKSGFPALSFACLLFPLFSAFLAGGEQIYTLRANDVLEISVYMEPDLKTTARVSQRGEISFPLLDRVKVAGLTTEEAEKLIEKNLKEGRFLKNPQVTIYIREYAKIKIYVYGAVKNPGAFSFEREVPTILKAIALAGGVTEKAYDSEIREIGRAHV